MIRGFRCKYDIYKYCESDKCDKCKNRADAIDEYIAILKKELDFCKNYEDLVVKLSEQLKEQKNDNR